MTNVVALPASAFWGHSRDGWCWHLFRPGARQARRAGKLRAACGMEMWLETQLAVGTEPFPRIEGLGEGICRRCDALARGTNE